jgi:DNA-binding beta-propeller fold protein YncE
VTGGDITRTTFDATRHFSGVRMQQGRVQLDADWNEQVDITAHRDRRAARDEIGPAGVPKLGGGFGLQVTPDGTDFALTAGRLYADGLLCEQESARVAATDLGTDGVTAAEVVLDGRELAAHDWVEVADAAGASLLVRLGHVTVDTRRLQFAEDVDPAPLAGPLTVRRVPTYATQVDHPAPELTDQPNLGAPRTLALDPGDYLAYLDVWERTVTALDEPAIREVALGGPDTTTRTRTVAQVRLAALSTTPDPLQPTAPLAEWDALTAPPGGVMAAFAEAEDPEQTPCVLPASGGFQGLENQLYRVQILDADHFVWSRENASVAAGWTGQDGDQITLAPAVGHQALGLTAGDWVELTDDTRELTARPGTLVQLLKAEGDTLTVDPQTASGSLDRADFPRNPKVRRWDSAGPQDLVRDTGIHLEAGVRVLFPSGGGYRSGDHWLVPARTGVPEPDWPRDSAGRPLPLPPHGIAHRFVRLALVRVQDTVTVTDWRRPFPGLTELSAEDVSFANGSCGLPDAVTVQDALDRLCQERDLRHHNRHLHGWGIVCGLAVHCGPDDGDSRRAVTVEPGYAIDAEGEDRDLDAEVRVDILDRIDDLATQGVTVLDENGDGDVSLVLDPSALDGIRAEKFRPRPTDAQSLFAGTLWLDFYNGYIENIRAFLDKQLSGDPADPDTVRVARQRRAALTNLANQAINPNSGQQVFVSPQEHALIVALYAELRAMLTSESFCAMFEGARPVPDYPFDDVGIETVAGTGRHSRLRVHPAGSQAYTFGGGTDPLRPKAQINRYDLRSGVLLAELNPVAGTQRTDGAPSEAPAETDTGSGAVQDVAFSPDGRRIYVAVASRSEDNTIFRSGTIAPDAINWNPPVTVCGMKLVSLATTDADPTVVYAVGQHKVEVQTEGKNVGRRFEWRGTALLRITPDQVDPNDVPRVALVDGFSPSGPLLIDAAGTAVLAGTAPDQDATSYTRLLRLQLPANADGSSLRWVLDLPSSGSDGIAFVTTAGAVTPTQVYAVLTPNNSAKAIVGFDLDGAFPLGAPAQLTTTAIALTGALDKLMVTEFDSNSVRMFDPARQEFLPDYRLPTQVGPAGIAPARRSVVVLNQVSNTLSVIPNRLVDPEFVFPADQLVTYRAHMLDAYADVLGGFLQYLKDGLCELLLVRCPEPDGTEVLHLGSVSVRRNEVYKICSFSGRKYVKSFPTVGYWLSLVPIQPLVARAVEMLCCLVLPESFAKRDFGGGDRGNDLLSLSTLLGLVEAARSLDLPGTVRDVRARVSVATETTTQALRALSPTVPPPGGATVSVASLIGQPTGPIAEALRARGVAVRRATFDPRLTVAAADSVVGLFRNPQPGSEVTLCEEDGRVKFFSVAGASPLLGRVHELESAMAGRDEELDRMRSTVDTARAVLEEAETLTARLAEARRELQDRDDALADLRQRLESLEQSQPRRRRRRPPGVGRS